MKLKTQLILLLIFISNSCYSQKEIPKINAIYDNQLYHFGFIIGVSNTKFQIDFKTDEVVDPAIEIINKLPNIKKNLCVASFSSQRLQKIRSKLSDVTHSMGPHEVLKLLLKSFGIYRGEISGDCLQIPIYRYGIKIVTQRFVDFCKRENIKISVWTINSIEEMDYLIGLDVDGIITDKPKALINLLASRNT